MDNDDIIIGSIFEPSDEGMPLTCYINLTGNTLVYTNLMKSCTYVPLGEKLQPTAVGGWAVTSKSHFHSRGNNFLHIHQIQLGHIFSNNFYVATVLSGVN
jgi:hypothetical protein